MNDLQIFSNQEFGTIRTTEIDGEPYFVGKDVAEALGYDNSNKAVQMHVDDDDKKVLDFKSFSQNGTTSDLWSGNDYSNKTLINESGVYALVFSSKLPKAKEFKHWVTSEVLPSIRKHGAYATPVTIESIIANPDNGIKLLTALKAEQEKLKYQIYDTKVRMQPVLAVSGVSLSMLTRQIQTEAERKKANDQG